MHCSLQGFKKILKHWYLEKKKKGKKKIKEKEASNKMGSKLQKKAQTWHGKMDTNLSSFVSVSFIRAFTPVLQSLLLCLRLPRAARRQPIEVDTETPEHQHITCMQEWVHRSEHTLPSPGSVHPFLTTCKI